MLPLAMLLTMAVPDPNKELFRVKDFVLGTEFVKAELQPGHPFLKKTSKDDSCAAMIARDLNDDPTPNYYLSLEAHQNTPESDRSNILAFHYDGRDMVVRRVGNAWPPKETNHVEHFVATTKRGRMLTVEWSSGFYGEKAWLRLEVDKQNHLRSAYAKTKEFGGHLIFPIRETHEVACDFD